MAPVFLNLSEVLQIHRDQIERYGSEPGVRDLGLLQSAVAMPSAGFGGRFLHNDLFEMAAAYLFHITQNHPFVDGNKRTGAVAAVMFLRMNNLKVTADEAGLEALVRDVAEGRAGKAEVAEFFRRTAVDSRQA